MGVTVGARQGNRSGVGGGTHAQEVSGSNFSWLLVRAADTRHMITFMLCYHLAQEASQMHTFLGCSLASFEVPGHVGDSTSKSQQSRTSGHSRSSRISIWISSVLILPTFVFTHILYSPRLFMALLFSSTHAYYSRLLSIMNLPGHA